MAEQDDPSDERLRVNKYRRNLLAQSLGPDGVNSRAYVSKDDYEKVQRLADQHKLRIPEIVGQLVRMGLGLVEKGQAKASFKPREQPVRPASEVDLAGLSHAMLHSRFEDETGATRFKLNSLVVFVACEVAEGRIPTAASIGVISGESGAKVSLMATTLEKRGILERKPIYVFDGKRSRRAMALSIASEAIQAFRRVHLEQTGIELPPYPGVPSPDKA